MLISSSPVDLKRVSLELFTQKNHRMQNEENTPLLGHQSSNRAVSDFLISSHPSDAKFDSTFNSIVEAISHGVNPEMIYQGSSGSYFAKDIDHKIIGVFKPKDEEPYGKLNPKWTKWMHKMCCPCCFGRSCLIPNQGYLSEAGASLVDSRFDLNIVPRTKVVRISSESFNYSAIDRAKSTSKQKVAMRFPNVGKHFHRLGLPPKVGSLQLFIHGSRNADYWLRQMSITPLSEELQKKFLFQFQKLVCLDYIIRNTDRGNDNWLLKYKKVEELANDSDDEDSGEIKANETSSEYIADGYYIKVVAIDNGLAFPFKHPDEWRAYPFHWAWLPIAKEPFTQEIKDLILPKLKNESFIASLVKDLYRLFKMLNLSHSLSADETPVQLVQKPVVTVERAKNHRRRVNRNGYRSQTRYSISETHMTNTNLSEDIPYDNIDGQETDDESSSDEDSNFIAKYYQRPFFSWF